MPVELPSLYVAGDVHLRDAGGPFPQFLDLLSKRPPARLVLLGDLFEYWLDTPGGVMKYAPVLQRLRALGASGWHIDFVRGNREMAGGRMLATSASCAMHWPRLDLTLGHRRIRIVHGDRLCHDPGYRSLRSLIESFFFRAWQALHPAWMQDAVARWIRRSSKGGKMPRSGASRIVLDARRVRGAARGRCDTVIAGHIHEQWRRTVGGVDLLLVGDWPGQRGSWIEGRDDGSLTLIQQNFPDLDHG